ncbi:ACT domain protein [Caldanaerobius fijiensis DSM 17918]|uniref:ACT domain protein n=1 Tax=Caldanaerobius fijiensis DSM 17918 TaxID=1121256 RepID=A0A1M4T8U4_9THEO|nr:ACT domain-containing protein [Caldanaerobius fijiensis]SHE40923.1 ACT domain protein [Caldanaerobius fijiensis DSM 17918]
MLVKQVSVFLENKPGRLADITRLLGDNGIDISALSLADTTNFGILRIIVNDPDRAVRIIKENGFTVKTTEVLAVEVEDRPGGLAKVLKILEEQNVSIEYAYSFVKRNEDKAYVLLKVEQPQKVVELLKDTDLRVLTDEEVYGL